MLGTLSTDSEGRFALKFTRKLAHPQAKVWRALTETDHLRSWFVEILDYDRSQLNFTKGARLEFISRIPSAETSYGSVIEADPPHLLEYAWGAEVLRWELQPAGDSACELTFINILDNREFAVAVAPGWHVGLDNLARLLSEQPSQKGSWEELAAEYERALN